MTKRMSLFLRHHRSYRILGYLRKCLKYYPKPKKNKNCGKYWNCTEIKITHYLLFLILRRSSSLKFENLNITLKFEHNCYLTQYPLSTTNMAMKFWHYLALALPEKRHNKLGLKYMHCTDVQFLYRCCGTWQDL